jgi:lysophospholipase L1-like esterase
VTVFGSSTTEGYGASDPATTGYPPVMRAILAPHVPGGLVLSNRGISGENIEGMARRFGDVLADRPDLVIWQAGSNDGPQGVPLARFEAVMRDGIARITASGADLILIEPQYCSVLEASPAFPPFLASIRGLGPPVFPRYELMRRWAEETGLGIDGLSPDGMHMDDTGYRLLGEAVASFILAKLEL